MKPTLLVLLLVMYSLNQPTADFDKLRLQMVNRQIIARGVRDVLTIQAMKDVPRHKFVPPDLQKYAYDDRPLSIGYGQTISQPYIVAYMTEKLGLTGNEKMLEIGTGSGYQAAVLSKIVKQVYSIEIVKPLAVQAQNTLKDLAYDNITVKSGDGYHGWIEHAPFDAIIVTAAVEPIPEPLIDQLAEGGRLIVPKGEPYGRQDLVLLEKKNGRMKTRYLLPVRFVPFTRHKD